MKTSNKLVLLLAILIVGGLFVSNYSLKQQFNEMDTSDLYWEFGTRESGKFHHIVICGGNLLKTTIIEGKESRIMRKGDLKDWLTATFKNDTLYIDYAERVLAAASENKRGYTSQLVYVELPELKSLTVENGNVDLENNMKNGFIAISGITNLSALFKKNGLSLDILVKDESTANINLAPKVESLNFKKLNINAYGRSELTFGNMTADSADIVVHNTVGIRAAAGILKHVRVK